MDRIEAGLPLLTPEELADPQTRVTINGFSVRLWQVTHLYGVNYDSQSAMPRSGASATHFRRLCPRPRDGEIRSHNPRTQPSVQPVAEGQPTLESSTVLRNDFASRGVQQSGTRRGDEAYLNNRGLLPLIDEVVDRIYSGDNEDEGEPVFTGAQLSAILDVGQAPSHLPSPPLQRSTPFHNPPHVVWADPSFPPPAFPPPNGPLPPLPPPRPASSRPHGQTHEQLRSTILSGSTLIETPRSSQLARDDDLESERTVTPTKFRQISNPLGRGQEVAASRAVPDNWPLITEPSQRPEVHHDVAAETAQSSITPAVSPQPPCMAASVQEPSTPSASTTGDQPVPITAHGRVVSPVPHVIPGADGYPHREPSATLSEPWPELSHSVSQQPLPSFLQHPPEFLQHDPYERAPPGLDPGQSRLFNRTRSSSALAARESRPATPRAEDDTATQSRWSPDSSPELTRMKKVKKALSFAKLRPKKSKTVLTQTEGDANGHAAAARLRASESSASSKEEPPLTTSAAPSVSLSTNGSGREGVRRKKSFYVI